MLQYNYIPIVICNNQVSPFRGLGIMVFNATFNNISVISWRSVLLVEETEYPGKPPTCGQLMTNSITQCIELSIQRLDCHIQQILKDSLYALGLLHMCSVISDLLTCSSSHFDLLCFCVCTAVFALRQSHDSLFEYTYIFILL